MRKALERHEGTAVLERCSTLAAVGQALLAGEHDVASQLLGDHYPFVRAAAIERKYTALESTRVFVRDGFIDRYSGARLIYPPALRLISDALPAEFPYHLHWKTDRTHPAYYELAATIDHLIPVTRGGPDDEPNWVTTSMARNSAKMNWSLDELGWTLHPAGRFEDWDGMLGWFVDYVAAKPELRSQAWVRQWSTAAAGAL